MGNKSLRKEKQTSDSLQRDYIYWLWNNKEVAQIGHRGVVMRVGVGRGGS